MGGCKGTDVMKRTGLALILLMGCAPELPSDGVVSDTAADDAVTEAAEGADAEADGVDLTLTLCGADDVQDLVGGPVEAGTDRFAEDLRVITPGMLVTQDYLPKRMDVYVDARGSITRITCG